MRGPARNGLHVLHEQIARGFEFPARNYCTIGLHARRLDGGGDQVNGQHFGVLANLHPKTSPAQTMGAFNSTSASTSVPKGAISSYFWNISSNLCVERLTFDFATIPDISLPAMVVPAASGLDIQGIFPPKGCSMMATTKEKSPLHPGEDDLQKQIAQVGEILTAVQV